MRIREVHDWSSLVIRGVVGGGVEMNWPPSVAPLVLSVVVTLRLFIHGTLVDGIRDEARNVSEKGPVEDAVQYRALSLSRGAVVVVAHGVPSAADVIFVVVTLAVQRALAAT
jgi:hypothetical protein